MSNQVPKVQLLKHPNKKSPNWYLRYRQSGPDGQTKEIWKSTRTAIKKEAEQRRRELERQLEEGDSRPADLFWDDFVKEFVAKHASRKAGTTCALYEDCLKTFGETMKPKRLSQVNLAMLEDFANARSAVGIKPATINKELRHLKAALRWAAKREFVRKVPDFSAVFIRLDETRPTTIPEEDFVGMIKALDQPNVDLAGRSRGWWRTFLYLAYYLGLRRGELLGLTWGQVSLDGSQLVVSAGSSKSRKDRPIPLRPEIVGLLREWQAEQANAEPSPEVLPWPHDSYHPLYLAWHAIQDAAGFAEGKRYVPKNCRSSCATELIRAGVPTVVVQNILGHQSIATTAKYYIDAQAAVKEGMEKRPVRIVDGRKT